MSRYTRDTRHVNGHSREGAVSAEVGLTLCNDCGAFVGDINTHNWFHDAVDRLADMTREADERAGMNRPIGFHRPFEDL